MKATESELQEQGLLVSAAACGDHTAATKIISDHHKSIASLAYPIYGLAYDKEDVLQYFWVCMLEWGFARYKPIVPLNYWLKMEFRARCRDILRQLNTHKHGMGAACESFDPAEEWTHPANFDTPETAQSVSEIIAHHKRLEDAEVYSGIEMKRALYAAIA